MTERNLSANARRATLSQSTNKVFVVLVTINHVNFTQPIRVSSDNAVLLPEAGQRGTISRGEEYVFVPFDITLPVQDETESARAQIVIDNVDRRMIQALRENTNQPLSITIELVVSDSPDTVEISMDDFRLERVTYDAFTITGDLSMEYFDLEPYPAGRFTPSGFPGIF